MGCFFPAATAPIPHDRPYADTGSHTVLCLAYAGAVAGDRRSLDTSSPGETIPTQGEADPDKHQRTELGLYAGGHEFGVRAIIPTRKSFSPR